ncbi:MAG: hypothetical protein OES25_04130 [Acidobacteriota bacterium]|nr:hypothetical protein [Acidobacteriota bacterium]
MIEGEEQPERRDQTRRRRPIRRVAQVLLIVVLVQAGLWLWVGRGALIRRMPEMVADDLAFLVNVGSDRDLLVDDGLPARRFMVHPRIASVLSVHKQNDLARTFSAYNGEMFADEQSWSAFSDPHLCRRCIAIGYSERWIYPFVARATTGYTMHPSTSGGWTDGREWPVMRRDHVYLFVFGVWVRVHDGQHRGGQADNGTATIPV